MFISAAGWWFFTSFTGSASEGIENNEKYALLHCNELQCLHMTCLNEDNKSWISKHNVLWSHNDTEAASSRRFECLSAKHWNMQMPVKQTENLAEANVSEEDKLKAVMYQSSLCYYSSRWVFRHWQRLNLWYMRDAHSDIHQWCDEAGRTASTKLHLLPLQDSWTSH